MKHSDDRYREWWWWAVNALTLVAVGLGGFYVFGEIKFAEQLYADLNLVASQQKNLNHLKNVWQVSAPVRQQLADYFFTPTSLPQFIERLEKTAAAAGVSLDLTNALTEVGAKPAVKLGFKVSGEFGPFFHFLALLDNVPAVLEINRLALNAPAAAARPALWQGEFSVRLLSFLPE